ncbi:MAG: ATP-dependent zinc metalloprotease FtsH [Oscillospiraceae bacterium]|jgi:cell division protease FtsH|nr:ATP-dependent zinc metalloprotease FtsH [Oscillospiraceae bacterium]
MNTNDSGAPNNARRPLLFSILISLVLILTFNGVIVPMMEQRAVKEITYTEFLSLLDRGELSKVNFESARIVITKDDDPDGVFLVTGRIDDPNLLPRLEEAGVEVSSAIPRESSPIMNFLLGWILPFGVLFLFGYLLNRSMAKRMGSGVMSFGKNTSKIYAENETGKNFQDVAGQDEAKESLTEIVDFLNHPDKYLEIGAKLPKGALLVGPPGTGKTLLARAVAGEAKVPFFSLSGSDFVELFVGMGASRVRDLFKQAEEKAPCIVFIDEIDAIGKSREGTYGIGGNDEREQTLNQLLSEMDGFDPSKGVVILAATNRPDVLDKALLRPGRFDRRIPVERPDLAGREAVLKVHARDVRMSAQVDLSAIARATPGAVGADLANIINEAALLAVRAGRRVVEQVDLSEAVETTLAGQEKKGKVLSPREKRIVACHETGHALVSACLPHAEKVHKVTIVPRTMGSLGYTMQVPEEDKSLHSKEEALAQITTLLAGRSAEEIVFQSITTGAANDIEQATKLARAMVTQYGMSDSFDMVALETVANPYLGGTPLRNHSETTAARVDEEVGRVIRACHEQAREILRTHRDGLDAITAVLLEKESLDSEEFAALCDQYVTKQLTEDN